MTENERDRLTMLRDFYNRSALLATNHETRRSAERLWEKCDTALKKDQMPQEILLKLAGV